MAAVDFVLDFHSFSGCSFTILALAAFLLLNAFSSVLIQSSIPWGFVFTDLFYTSPSIGDVGKITFGCQH